MEIDAISPLAQMTKNGPLIFFGLYCDFGESWWHYNMDCQFKILENVTGVFENN